MQGSSLKQTKISQPLEKQKTAQTASDESNSSNCLRVQSIVLMSLPAVGVPSFTESDLKRKICVQKVIPYKEQKLSSALENRTIDLKIKKTLTIIT